MDKKVETNKVILIILIPVLLLILLGILFYININKTITIEGTVKYINTKNNYIIIKDNNSKDEYILKTSNDYNKGDILSLTLYKLNNNVDPKQATIKKVNIISRTKEINPLENKMNNTEDPIYFFYELNDDLDNYKKDKSLGDKIKTNFITIIDFIFYDKEVNGKKFNDLTTNNKLKILKLAFKIDNKMNTILPEYKETLEYNYQNVKGKLTEKYLDIASYVCSNNEDTCSEAKEGIKDLKDNFSITWTYIKNISGVTADKLKSWYEIWRDNNDR